MAKSTSLLDLSTTGEIRRKHFTIDKVSYEIRDMDELALSQQQRMAHAGKYFEKYLEDAPDESADATASKILNDCIDLICVDLPAKVRDKLADAQKFKIFKAFSDANELGDETKKK